MPKKFACFANKFRPLGEFTSVRLLVKFTPVIFNQPLVFRTALKAEIIFFAARFFLEAVRAKWGRQQRERPLESKLKQLGRKNKLVKENAAASNEVINFRERMIMAISEIGHVSLSPLIMIVIFSDVDGNNFSLIRKPFKSNITAVFVG